MTDVVTHRSTAIGERGVEPANAQELMAMAKWIAESKLKPDGITSAADAFLVMAVGLEWGFGAMMALQTLHVVKGRVSLPGETCAALIQNHPLCADYQWGFEGEGDERVAWVQTVRKGRPGPNPRTSFSWADATRARLTGGDNWTKYPDDMLYWKAVAREKRRNWPDIYPGLRVSEDIAEIGEPELDVTPLRHAPVPDPLLEGAYDVAPVPSVGNEGSQSSEAGEPDPVALAGPASDPPGGVSAPERSAETVPAEDAPPVLPAAPAPAAEITEAWSPKGGCIYCHRHPRFVEDHGHGVDDDGKPCRFKK